jgi:hypothetical protein
MISIKHIAIFAAFAAAFTSSAALANETYTCSNGDQKREIAVVYSSADSTVPCEVTYTKEDGSSQSLWQAQNEAGYCEEKAAAFVEKQRGWGWECNKQ